MNFYVLTPSNGVLTFWRKAAKTTVYGLKMKLWWGK